MRLNFGFLVALRARAEGRRDGRLSIPSDEEAVAVPHGLDRISARASQHLAALAAGWSGEDRRLKATWQSAVRTFIALKLASDRAASELAGVQRLREQRVQEAEAERSFRRENGRGGLDREGRLNPWFYRLLLCGIVLGELAITTQVFRVFRDSELMTWVITLSPALALVLCAHSLGKYLRLERASRKESLMAAVKLLVALGFIVSVSFVRGGYLREIDAGGSGLTPATMVAVFLGINLVIFAAAVELSYARHSGARDEVDAARRDERKYQRRADRVRQRLAKAQKAVSEAESHRKKRHEQVVNGAFSTRAWYDSVRHGYCASNIRARRTHLTPPVLGSLAETCMPEGLTRPLDWSLDEVPNLVIELPQGHELSSSVAANGHVR